MEKSPGTPVPTRLVRRDWGRFAFPWAVGPVHKIAVPDSHTTLHGWLGLPVLDGGGDCLPRTRSRSSGRTTGSTTPWTTSPRQTLCPQLRKDAWVGYPYRSDY